jgi:predicted transcriptional regulator
MENHDKSLSDAALRVVEAFAARESATVEEVLTLARHLPEILNRPAAPGTAAAPVGAPEVPARSAEPAVPIADSVSDSAVVCLCCGKSFVMLKRHLNAEHGLTEAEYRALFHLPESHPLVAPSYSQRKAEYAKRVGLGKYARQDGAGEEGQGSPA